MSTLSSAGAKYGSIKDNFFGGGVIDIAKSLGGDALGSGFDALDLYLRDDSESDNPYFRQNGYDDPSPDTIWFFRKKFGIGLASAGMSLAGAGPAIKGATGYESKLTWYKMSALAEQMIPPSRRGKPPVMQGWYGFRTVKQKAVPSGSLETIVYHIIKMKTVSVGSNSVGTGLGIAGWLGLNVGSWIADTIHSLASGRLSAWFEPASQALAKVLQWQAFRERVLNRKLGSTFGSRLSQGGGKAGKIQASSDPASRIVEAIWDYTATLSGGRSPWPFIAEPKGWMVLADVINRV